MDPLKFIEPEKKEPMFKNAIHPVKVKNFSTAGMYEDWVEENPYIEVINVSITPGGTIVLTYKELI